MKSISDQIADALIEVTEDVKSAAAVTIEEIAAETVTQLRQTSPRNTGRYARSWRKTKTKETTRFGIPKVTVYNTQYRLTHLLENGHATKNGGRTAAQPHIKPAEDRAFAEIERRFTQNYDAENR